MLENFETFSVDADVWSSIRNVQAEFRRHVSESIHAAVETHLGHPVTDSLLLEHGELIHLPGSDLHHFAFDGVPLMAWTEPKLEKVGVTRVHLTYRIGTLPPATDETLRLIEH